MNMWSFPTRKATKSAVKSALLGGATTTLQ